MCLGQAYSASTLVFRASEDKALVCWTGASNRITTVWLCSLIKKMRYRQDFQTLDSLIGMCRGSWRIFGDASVTTAQWRRTRDLRVDLNPRFWTSLPMELSWFNAQNLKIGLFVCKFKSYFQSLMDVQPLWHVDVYQQNVFRRDRNEAEHHSESEFVFNRIHANPTKFKYSTAQKHTSKCKKQSLRSTDHRSWHKPVVAMCYCHSLSLHNY